MSIDKEISELRQKIRALELEKEKEKTLENFKECNEFEISFRKTEYTENGGHGRVLQVLLFNKDQFLEFINAIKSKR